MSPRPPGNRHLVLATDDFDRCAETFGRIWRPYRGLKRLGTGPFHFQMKFLPLSQIAMSEFEIRGGVDMKGGSLESLYTVAIPLVGGLRFRMNHQELAIHTSMASVYSATQTHGLRVSGSVQLLNVRLQRSALERELSHLLDRLIGQPILFQLGLDLRHGIGPSIARFLQYLSAELNAPHPLHLSTTLAIRQAERTLLTMLLEGQQHNYWDELQNPLPDPAPWQVRRAEEFARAHLQQPLSMADLAKAVGVSGRSLRAAFHRSRGCSPGQFIRRLRLEQARRDLLTAEPGETVSEVAIKWGFMHIGRFAINYRQAFKESPSETLRRRVCA